MMPQGPRRCKLRQQFSIDILESASVVVHALVVYARVLAIVESECRELMRCLRASIHDLAKPHPGISN